MKRPGMLISQLFGQVSWIPPGWIKCINEFRRQRQRLFWGWIATTLLLLATGYSVFSYYQSLPKDVLINILVKAPGLTPNSDVLKPQPLVIDFTWDRNTTGSGQNLRYQQNPSVARIDLADREIELGITMVPEQAGTWRWQGDHKIVFEPKRDWPADQQYQLEFDPAIFVPEAKFNSLIQRFSTPAFDADIHDLSFHQDPVNKTIRRAVGTIRFTHSVDEQSLKEKLNLLMRPMDEPDKPVSLDYNLSFDKHRREAYVQSSPISLPEKENYLKFVLAKGVKSADGKAQTRLADDNEKILIPDIYSFLKVTGATARIVKDKEGQPEQFINLQFTDDIALSEIEEKVRFFLLPKYRGRENYRHRWKVREVTEQVLSRAEPVNAQRLPNQRDSSSSYSFRIDVPEQRYLYVSVEGGLQSASEFVMSDRYDTVLTAPSYPREVKVMGQGSLLSVTGKRQLGFMVRGLDGVKVSVGKLLPNQVNHLVSQSWGDMGNPRFQRYRFNIENLARSEQRVIPIVAAHPKTANYASIDLDDFFRVMQAADKSAGEREAGVFFIRVQGWDTEHDRAVGPEDTRTVLLTDLGIIAKHNRDGSQQLFVQSVRSGQPVAGATVELLGKNGMALFTEVSDRNGHIRFPSAQNFEREKQPTVYTVRKNTDTAFIPYNRATRQINYSKFNVGGVRSHYSGPVHNNSRANKKQLKAYLFSDRGIYRPGETARFGAIVRQQDFNVTAGIPLQMHISGPRGNRLSKQNISLPAAGLFDFKLALDATSATGHYQARLYLVTPEGHPGEQLGSVGFRVEEFQPDTLKITSSIAPLADAGSKPSPLGWITDRQLKAVIQLDNLFGSPAQNRKISAVMKLIPGAFRFQRYKDYTFIDPYLDPEKARKIVTETLSETATDDNGAANFELSLQQYERGAYVLDFTAQGFDQGGGRSVTARNRVLVSPSTELVGYKADGELGYLRRGQQRNLSFIAIDNSLNPRELSGLTLQHIEKRPVSSLVQQRNGTFKYQTVLQEKPLSSKPFKLSAQGADYPLPTAEPGQYELRVTDANGNLLSKVAYQVIGAGSGTGALEKNAELTLKLDKKSYRAGDTVEMHIAAPYTGSGLITVESDKVHAYKWFNSDSENSVQTIQVPDTLEGNAYINVAFIRAPDSKQIFTSPLSYAVQPFDIDRSKRRIDIVLEVPELARPGKPMRIAYRTDKAAKMVVFAVDEGILQVANYQSPKPLNHFLQKRALEVTSYQILDQILPEYSALLEAAGIGGGARAAAAQMKSANLNPFRRSTDKPAVFWSGIVESGDRQKTVSFDIPDTFSGSLKVMAVAVSSQAMGAASADTTVRGPFVLSPNLLTVAAPGDEFLVTLGVANGIEGSGKNTAVAIAATVSDNLTLLDGGGTLAIGEGDEGKMAFRVQAGDGLGEARITFTASTRNPKTGVLEESQRSATLSLRPPQAYLTTVNSGYSKRGKATLRLRPSLYPQLAEQHVASAASPLVLVDGLTSYLQHYPHGCTEQVVSQVFPWLGLVSHPAYHSHITEARKKFTVLINRLRSRQQSNGGFSLWPGNHRVAAFPSVYVMHFLTEARELGYNVPGDMYQSGIGYLRTVARSGARGWYENRIRANAIYLLTRNGEVTTNYLVDMQESLEREYPKQWRRDLSALYMGATYQLLQNEKLAAELMSKYQIGGDSGRGNDREYGDYHSSLTMDAQYVYLLAKHFPKRLGKLSGDSMLELLQPLFEGDYNTISAAYSVLALSAYRQNGTAQDSGEIEFSVVMDGKQQPLKTVPSAPFARAHFAVGASELNLKGDRPLFYLVSQAGYDRELPTRAVRDNLEITRSYLNADGNEIGDTIFQGEEVTVRLRIRSLNGEHINNVVAIDLLPGGFEVIRNSIPRTAYGWRADYVDVREDRLVFYGSFGPQVTELEYRVKATAAGEFVVPPVSAESMYDRTVKASSTAGKIVVKGERNTTVTGLMSNQ